MKKGNYKVKTKICLKEGDIIKICGYENFEWQVKYGYSDLLKQWGLYGTTEGNLMHCDLGEETVTSINGVATIFKK